jgi:translation initiation factor IF-3
VNENVPNRDMRIIDADGVQLGVFGKAAALALAKAKGLDIVVVSPEAQPMVAKLMDYSKFKYEQKKKQKEAKKNQHIPDLKEIQLSPVIQKHDIDVRLKNARKFLESGDRVKVVMRLKGRMISHADIGKKVMEDFFSELQDIAVMEKKLQLDERFFNMTLIKKK